MSHDQLGWWTVLPPMVAIGFALLSRRVALSLAAGVVTGALVATDFRPWQAAVHLVTIYLWPTLSQPTNLRILAFAFVLGGMIRLLSVSGGSAQMAGWVTRYASNRRRGQLTAWALGLVFFFDDYANTLFVGSSMRSVSDRLRISREKLAFIVDATAAPIASLAPLSSWIIVEVGYIADQFRALEIPADAYQAFLATIPLRFYPLWMLALGLWIALAGRDFGPMLRAERRSVAGAGPADPGDASAGDQRADELSTSGAAAAPASRQAHGARSARGSLSLAFAPLVTAMATIAVGLLVVQASSSEALLGGVLAGGAVALALAVRQRHLSWGAALLAWLRGGREMSLVLAVLLLAWMLGAVCRDLQTAQYLVRLLGHGFPVGLLPSAVFLVSALISFGTGTSWGTMGILFPLALPLSHALAPGDMNLMLGAVASILAGSVFGDHCSPISDTTIMSAMASGCSQLEHVRTQLPYALVVGAVSVVCGTLPVALGWFDVSIALPLGAVVLWGIVRVLGQPAESPDPVRVVTAPSRH